MCSCMGYSNPSFLNTKQEHDRWHKGIYDGLKIHDPRKLYEKSYATGDGFKSWYHGDGHYHDFTMYSSYCLKLAAYSFAAKVLGVPAALGL